MFGKGIKMFIKIKVISFNPGLQPCSRLFCSISCICYTNSIPDQRESSELGGKRRESKARWMRYFIYFLNYEIITIIRADQSHSNEWRRESRLSLCNYYHIQASKQEPRREKQLTEAVKLNEVFFIITFCKNQL